MRCLQVGLLLVLTAWARANPGYVGAPIAVASVPAVSVSSQYHAQDTLGQYSYGYSGGPSAKAETKTADGVTRGSYSYVDAHGLVQTSNYVSDPVNGFRVAATNLAHDTPEVAAAKAAHFAAYVEAAAAAEANPDIPEPVEHVAVESAPLVYTGSAPVAYTGSAPVAYTGSAPVAVSSVPAVYSGSHGFAYSTSSVAPTYAPHFYSSVLPSSVITYTAPGIVSSADSNGGFSYSATSVAPTYAPHYYSAVLPASTFPVLPSGVPADTPEVAAAKAAHYAAHFTEKLRHLYHGHYYY